ncbi:hypothetical protein D9757_009950 [Collybiopsis confluens]|uniref:Fungal-type protein kinase domain-containing protein n=1 Tax=Collybiopsis confluens TaxID=2823264 RepID=A0A8H5H2J6_9AGAR|nr:hypothetical protein D9757_009950 [Collybiopsis confluens]
MLNSLDWEGNDLNQNILQKRLKSHFGEAYEMRSLRATVLEKPKPLSSLRSAREFAQFTAGSTNSQKFCIVTSVWPTSCSAERATKHRTGTKPFMAHNLLNTNWDKGHFYRHDLESLFYIILILSCLYTGLTTRASTLLFEDWFDGVDQVPSNAKYVFILLESSQLPQTLRDLNTAKLKTAKSN